MTTVKECPGYTRWLGHELTAVMTICRGPTQIKSDKIYAQMGEGVTMSPSVEELLEWMAAVGDRRVGFL